MSIPDYALPSFLDEMEKVAGMTQIRNIQSGVQAAAKNYQQLRSGVGLRRFIPFTKARRRVDKARLDLKATKRKAAQDLRKEEQDAMRSAMNLKGGDNAEAVATMQAARLARKGRAVPEAFTPSERQAKQRAEQAKKKVEEADKQRAESLSKFKTRAGLGAAGVGAGALYLGTRPDQSRSMGY